MTSEYPPPGMGVGRVREAKEPLVPMGVLVWTVILDTSLGLGSLHLLGLISVYLGPLELLQLLEEAGGRPRGTSVSVCVSQPSSEPRVPLHILCGKRDLDLGISALTWEESNAEGSTSDILWNIWSRGEGDGPNMEVKAPVQLGFDSALCQEEAGEEDTWL